MLQYKFFLHPQAQYFVLHIVTVYLSYIIFFVGSIAAALYLIQNNLLKNKRAGIVLGWLPSLSFLDKLNYRSIGLGFPVLTLSILIGFIWAENVRGSYGLSFNPRQIYSLILWLIYAVTLHVRLSAKMRGRKVAFLSLAAFCVIIISLFGACR